jgi:hypothetical protein
VTIELSRALEPQVFHSRERSHAALNPVAVPHACAREASKRPTTQANTIPALPIYYERFQGSFAAAQAQFIARVELVSRA